MAAASATSTMTAAVSTARTSATTRAATLALGTSFIHHQCASQKILAIESGDCLFSFRVIANFRKAESPRLPCKAVAQQRE